MILAVLAFLWAVASPRPATAAWPARPESLLILHTNDIHAHILPFQDPKGATVGGAAAILGSISPAWQACRVKVSEVFAKVA